MQKIHPVILAGGTGSRLWPLSRSLNPKQFLPLVDADRTMLQMTLERLEGTPCNSTLVICNEEHRFLAAEQLRNSSKRKASILLEPFGRDTAPAIALAAFQALAKYGDGQDVLLLVLAADHWIRDTDAFTTAVATASEIAATGKLVTFGIVPTHPETGFGYIAQGNSLGNGGYEVAEFVEKPNLVLATQYIEGGEHLWNSGMFMFGAQVFLDELKAFRPEIYKACELAIANTTQDLDFTRIDANSFSDCPAESIDFAVMEHTKNAAVVPLDAGWSDIGSWSAIWDISDKDENGNIAKGDALLSETNNSFVQAEHRLVTTLGIKDMIVIETKDAVLVAHKDKVQDVKNIVNELKNSGRHEHLNHREVYRPWGSYDSIDMGDRYQVKRITVSPGAKLSVQMHHHRAEHWVVVSGTAKVTNGEDTILVTENQSTYIPLGQIHSLENPGKVPLELIEVQSGSYLGEDDIVRFEDRYGRALEGK